MKKYIKKNIHIFPIVIVGIIFSWIIYENLAVANKKIRVDRENMTNI